MANLHPALTVTNISNFIPIVLDHDDGQYTSWVELFKIHCHAHDVINHIIPAEGSSSKSPGDKDKEKINDKVPWKLLDYLVLQWIYSTISKDLLITILKPDYTTEHAWKTLQNIFIDSKPSRALYLENRFFNVRLEYFPNVSAYCQELKTLSNQLSNVDAPVSKDRLVLQLIAGLGEKYENIATHLQQTFPLPDFYTARSKLILEETRKAHIATTSSTALLVATKKASVAAQQPISHSTSSHDRSTYDQQQHHTGGHGQ
ncbi:hypothetical protein Lser_V15G15379 [Lactuca serriola]